MRDSGDQCNKSQHTDGLGSTTGLTDSSGSVVATYQYDIYGAVRSQTGSSTDEFTFTGEQNDATGLEYLRARYYDSSLGRFISKDPISAEASYAYVQNNPLNAVDPSGDCLIQVRGYHIPHWINRQPLFKVSHAFVYTYDPIDGSEKVFEGGPLSVHLSPILVPVGVPTPPLPIGTPSPRGQAGTGGQNRPTEYLLLERSYNLLNAVSTTHVPGSNGAPIDVWNGGQNESCDQWRSSFNQVADRIVAANQEWHLLGPNSNTVASTLLEGAGLPQPYPNGGIYWGWGQGIGNMD